MAPPPLVLSLPSTPGAATVSVVLNGVLKVSAAVVGAPAFTVSDTVTTLPLPTALAARYVKLSGPL